MQLLATARPATTVAELSAGIPAVNDVMFPKALDHESNKKGLVDQS